MGNAGPVGLKVVGSVLLIGNTVMVELAMTVSSNNEKPKRSVCCSLRI